MKITEMQIKGYKNLIDCTVPLGDFNVIVGPNNSGKSNFLEIFGYIGNFFYPSGEEVESLLAGDTLSGSGSSIPHTPPFTDMPFEARMSFETQISTKHFVMDYKLAFQRSNSETPDEHEGFLRELFSGKEKSKTGVAKQHIRRERNTLTFMGKNIPPIDEYTSLMEALRVHIRKFISDAQTKGTSEDLDQLREFAKFPFLFGTTPILAFSPAALRRDLSEGVMKSSYKYNSICLTTNIDNLYKNRFGEKQNTRYNQFREAACNILDLDDIKFNAKEFPIPSAGKGIKKIERIRRCFVKLPGGDYVDVSECSDGTLMVLAILATVLEDRYHPLICIEEPEMLTTHSPYLLNSVSPEDVIVALPDENAATVFRKPQDIKKINKLLKSGFFSLGDLLVDNFAEVL